MWPPLFSVMVSPMSSMRASASVMMSKVFMLRFALAIQLAAHNVTTLFTAEQIHARITSLAAHIDADYPEGEPLHFVAVLKGAFVFLSDLARSMPRPVTLDFIAV